MRGLKLFGFHSSGRIVNPQSWKEGIMGNTALKFILDAKKWPLGGILATAVGTAADEKEGELLVRQLMIEEGVGPNEAAAEAPGIYRAVKEFIENTQFKFKPGKKYWRDKSVSPAGAPARGNILLPRFGSPPGRYRRDGNIKLVFLVR